MSIKVYVHIEDDNLEITSIVKCLLEDKILDIVSKFINNVSEKIPTIKDNIDFSKYKISRENGKELDLSLSLSKAKITDKTDLFISLKEPIKEPLKEENNKEIKEPSKEDINKSEKLKKQGNDLMQKKEYKKAINYYNQAIILNPMNAILYSNRAQAYLNRKEYMEALNDSKMAISLDETFIKGYLRAGKACLSLNEFKEAKNFFLIGLKYSDVKHDKLYQIMSKEFRRLIKDCEIKLDENNESIEKQKAFIEEYKRSVDKIKDLFQKGKFKDVVVICKEILQVLPNEKLATHYSSTILLAAKRYKDAILLLEPAVKAHPDELELRISLSDAYYNIKEYMKSMNLLTDVHSKIKDKNDNERLSIRIAKNLVEIGQIEAASKLITEILQVNDNNIDALIVYGDLLLDRNILNEAIKVYLRALILQSENKQIKRKLSKAVAQPKGLEILLKEIQDANSASALGFLALIFKDHGAINQSEYLFKSSVQVSDKNPSYVLNYVHVLEIVVKYQDAFNSMNEYLIKYSPSLPLSKSGKLDCSKINNIIKHIKDINSIIKNRTKNPKNGIILSSVYINDDKDNKIEHKLNAKQLDLLALLFTLVKVLFVTGHIEIVHKLVEIIETIRVGKEFHLTSIRNEHAYYCCIARLVSHIPVPISPYNPIYVIGDSHTLPTAWQTLNIKGNNYTIIPKLVTGCKMWHLRDESYFFTKDNFYNQINSIPNGSTVIFLFGEIDCREGIQIAVEKCCYNTIEEGMNYTIDIYIKVLFELFEKKKFNINIHPVIPVLNETRATVIQFNELLQKKLQVTPFHWLDFFSNLLEDGNFKEEYSLDGTHMNPSYLTLIENTLKI